MFYNWIKFKTCFYQTSWASEGAASYPKTPKSVDKKLPAPFKHIAIRLNFFSLKIFDNLVVKC